MTSLSRYKFVPLLAASPSTALLVAILTPLCDLLYSFSVLCRKHIHAYPYVHKYLGMRGTSEFSATELLLNPQIKFKNREWCRPYTMLDATSRTMYSRGSYQPLLPAKLQHLHILCRGAATCSSRRAAMDPICRSLCPYQRPTTHTVELQVSNMRIQTQVN